MSTGGVVAVIAGVLASFVVLPAVIVLRLAAGERRHAKALEDPSKIELSQKYASRNGLVTAHYPADFAAQALEQNSLLLSRNFGRGEAELVVLAAVENPVSTDVREFARVYLKSVEKTVTSRGGSMSTGEQLPATCRARGVAVDGVKVDSASQTPPEGPYSTRWCFFMHAGHGYVQRYTAPRSRVDAERPLLERIVAATEVSP